MTKNQFKSLENMCKNHDYCHLKILEQFNKILKYNQDQNSMNIPFLIYGDTESLLEKIQTRENNPEKLFTIKVNKHMPCGYSIFT